MPDLGRSSLPRGHGLRRGPITARSLRHKASWNGRFVSPTPPQRPWPDLDHLRSRIAVRCIALLAVPTIVAATFAGDPAVASSARIQPRDLISRIADELSWLQTPPSIARCISKLRARCYTAPQLLSAYGIDRLHKAGIDGRGTKIAVLVSPSPTLQADLNRAARAWKLPKTKIRTIKPSGDVPYSFDGAVEATLDTQAAHFVAPRAKILFVVVSAAAAASAGNDALEDAPLATAINAAVKAGADVISMSFSGTEQPYPHFRSAIARAHQKGVAVVTSSGDTGVVYGSASTGAQPARGTNYPQTDRNVTAVGGTLMTLSGSGRRLIPDIAWGPDALGGASGGGVSGLYARPGWQRTVKGTVATGRNYPDISMNGADSSGFLVAITLPTDQGPQKLFHPISGTSESAPLFAGIVALAVQAGHHRLPNVNRALYSLARRPGANGLTDVVQGNNSYAGVAGFVAQSGYDLVSGVGTVGNAPRFVRALARKAKR